MQTPDLPAAKQAAAELTRYLEALVRDGTVPGAVALVYREGLGPVLHQAHGQRCLEPTAEPATLETLWDCASLTKPLITASCLLRLRAQGQLDFGQPISDFLPGWAEGECRPPTIAELLLHTSGLPVWEPLYAAAPGGLADRVAWLSRHRSTPGGPPSYGCPAYQVLGSLIERVSGASLADFARSELLAGREDLFFPLPVEQLSRCAATERGNAREREMAGLSEGDYSGWRQGLIRGTTHDHNADTLGGAAGNAGLFASAAGLAFLAERFLRPGFFTELDLEELRQGQGGQSGRSAARTWGFEKARAEGSPAGPRLGDEAFGHVGFTGTSLFLDPQRRAFYILLTNRVHPAWTSYPFNAVRREFHALAADLAEACDG